jgi:hypothetical protein
VPHASIITVLGKELGRIKGDTRMGGTAQPIRPSCIYEGPAPTPYVPVAER